MSERANQDTEVVLGTGRLLGLFFSLVIVCAVFFAFGYSLGRKSVPEAPLAEAQSPGITVQGAPKPTANKAAGNTKPCKEGEDCAPSTSDELTFFKSVEEKDASAAQLEQKPAAEAPAQAAAAPELHPPSGPGYLVQVAAVSKREDAEALVSALRKKQYPVFVMDAAANDQFFRVQVGPYPQLKEAEAVKSRLQGDGYNPILRR